MTKCTSCRLKYPDHLLSEMASSISGKLTYTLLCPICALRIRNETMGLPPDTPFSGEMASKMFDEALAYAQKHYRLS
ncbi:MAG: hypothetical protein UT61_C0062G0003 [Candidatus Woesebacteria bacterium GW2011_GWA1_39_8]|uniref:Uncharacterized protein n=1 Tax=Candidatus Woesebacteria bacterium GW2011_GWA1_39_8 TaxID=1618552 RepID=A0A0G0PIZ9_9BACT|nr:MAG: hypothetical protein UT61_C0062G0003 [Candidatus Woesebacteria bacterium GW2011_GWA1_39_8]